MENKLNLGCGNDIKEGFDNVDVQIDKRIFKSFDLNTFPYPLNSNHYDYVLIKQVLEHLFEIPKVMDEIYRVCKNKAIIRIEVPYYNNKGSYNDIEHIHYFSDITFECFVDERTRVDKKKRFRIKSMELTPTLAGKFLISNWLRRKLSLFIGGLISQIHLDLEVLK